MLGFNKASAGRRPGWRRVVAIIALTLLAAVLWVSIVGYGVLAGWWHRPIAERGNVPAFTAAATRMIDKDMRGNAAFVLIERGKPVAQVYRSRGRIVGPNTMFQVASLSKWLTAWGVMKLVEDDKLDLDAPVSRYLKRWRLPDSPDNSKVTIRRLLSHTAGLTDDLGFGGFAPGMPVQRLEDALTHAVDASPGKDGRVRVGQTPGAFRYSGGGYALLQLLVEEVSGEPFDRYMARAIFRPLGLTHTSFATPAEGADVAQSFDTAGRPTPLLNFSAPAATGLYTSAADMTRLIQAQQPGPRGEPADASVLSPQTLDRMRVPEASQFGLAIWGLGTILYAPNNRDGFIVGHDGSNTPAINTSVRLDPATGDGIVLLETGDPGLATALAGEWVYWKTGNIDLLLLSDELKQAIPAMAGGILIALLAGIAALVVATLRARRVPVDLR